LKKKMAEEKKIDLLEMKRDAEGMGGKRVIEVPSKSVNAVISEIKREKEIAASKPKRKRGRPRKKKPEKMNKEKIQIKEEIPLTKDPHGIFERIASVEDKKVKKQSPTMNMDIVFLLGGMALLLGGLYLLVVAFKSNSVLVEAPIPDASEIIDI